MSKNTVSADVRRLVWDSKTSSYNMVVCRITVDFEKLADELVRKAASRKSRKQKAVRGGVDCKVIDSHRHGDFKENV